MPVEVGSAVGYLDLNINGFLSGLKQAQSEAQDMSRNLEQKVGASIKGFGDSLTATGMSLTKYVTVPLAGISIAGLKVATDFEKAMSQVKAITKTTGNEFNELREVAIDLGASTAFSANEVAGAMTEMAKAGWSSEQIIAGMAGVLDATAASGEQLSSVATIVADAITGFGMKAADSARVADLLTQAANSGTIGITDLGESFKFIAPVANSVGLSIEDVTTAIAALSMAGIKGSQAGTVLRGMLSRMITPTDEMQKVMDKLNFSLTNTDGSFKSLETIVGELRGKFSNMTDEQKAYNASILAGTEGMSGLLALTSLSEEQYTEISKSMQEAGGVAKETASIMQDNLTSKIEQLGGSLESLAIKLADYVIPYIQDFVLKLTDLVDKFTKLDPEMQKSILKIGGIAFVTGPAIIGLGKLTTGIGSLITAFGGVKAGIAKLSGLSTAATQTTALGTAIGGITAPIIAVVAAIGVLVAAFVSLWKNNESFKNNIIGTWTEIKETITNFFQSFVDKINDLGFTFKDITDVLSTVWTEFCNLLAPVFEGAFQYIANTIKYIFDVILGIVDIFVGIFTLDWERVWQGIKDIFTAVWTAMKGFFVNIFTTIYDASSVILGWFGTNWEEIWTSIRDFFINIWVGIKTFISDTLTGIRDFFVNIFTSIIDGVKDFIDKIVWFFSDLPYNIGLLLGFAIGTVINFVKDLGAKAVEGGTAFLENLGTFFKQLPLSMAMWFVSTMNTINNWRTELINKAIDIGEGFINNLIKFFKELPGKIGESFKNAFVKVVEWKDNLVQGAKDSAKGFIDNFIEGFKFFPTKLMEIGENIVSGIWDGIVSAKDTFVNNVTGFFSGIVDGIKASLGIHSPSTVFADEIGKWLPPGVSNGFKSALPKALTDIQGFLDQGVKSLKADNVDIVAGIDVNSTTSKLQNSFDFIGSLFDTIDMRMMETIMMLREGLENLLSFQSQFAFAGDGVGYFSNQDFVKTKNISDETSNKKAAAGESDIFIFNSPKPIDEIEAARRLKAVKKELLED